MHAHTQTDRQRFTCTRIYKFKMKHIAPPEECLLYFKDWNCSDCIFRMQQHVGITNNRNQEDSLSHTTFHPQQHLHILKAFVTTFWLKTKSPGLWSLQPQGHQTPPTLFLMPLFRFERTRSSKFTESTVQTLTPAAALSPSRAEQTVSQHFDGLNLIVWT